MSEGPLQPGQVVSSRYRIERPLGEGGMGSVYRAVQISVDRPVALKVISDIWCKYPLAVERFQREGRALARLKHQNTVCLFDFGATERGQPFIVMELLEGCDLGASLQRHGPLGWVQAFQICVQVLQSLEEAHRLGIVHRDIKPANLFLCSRQGQPPFVKVLDFGISGLAEADKEMAKLTAEGAVMGSPAYMSPEQAQGRVVTSASDLYSLGVCLFEMLTGKTPFEAETRTAMLLAKINQPAPTLHAVCPHLQVPDGAQALLEQLLMRDPALRLSSAGDVGARIEGMLGSQQQRSTPPSGTPEASSSRVGRGPAVARTEPMPFAVGATLDSPGVNTAPGKRRNYTLGWVAIAPLALLCAFGLRLVLHAPQPEHIGPEPGPETAVHAPLQPGPAPAPVPQLPAVDSHEPAPEPAKGAIVAVPASPTATLVVQPPPRAPAPAGLAPIKTLAVPTPQYKTIAEAVAARDAGKLSTQQMNRIVRPLQRAEEDELRTVGDAYKAGDMELPELKKAQQAIQQKYEGVP